MSANVASTAAPWHEPGLDGAVETALTLARVVEQVRRADDLVPALAGAATVAAETLGYRGVSIDLARPAADDFCAVVVVGSEESRQALLGSTTTRAMVERIMDPQFTRRGCQVVDAGQIRWHAEFGDSAFYVPDAPVSDDPSVFHPEDALLIPLRAEGGRLLGVMWLDEPHDGRRPTDARLELAAIIARHAAHAVEEALRLLRAGEHRLALLRLVAISGRLHEQDPQQVLSSICDAISSSLAFARVAITLTEDGAAPPRAAVGWTPDDLAAWTIPTGRLLDPRHERAGCHLIEEPGRDAAHGGWHHRLLVALRAPEGDLVGVIWVDDPDDGLVPDEDRLRALRLFADQATLAVLDARRRDELRAVARHDALTGLRNRMAFVEELRRTLPGASGALTIVLLDLDHFKAINDDRGHLAGDDALRRVARTMRAALRSGAGAFRIGGDEFAVLLPGPAHGEGAEVAERLDARLRAAGVPASFGVAVSCDGERPSAFMARADAELMAAKRGRGRERRTG